MLFSYFGNVMQWKKWRVPMMIVSLPVVLAMLASFVLAVLPGDQVGSIAPALSWSVLYVLGIIITGICITAMAVVLTWARRFDADDFSNPADFPVTSARKWISLVAVNVTLCWVAGIIVSKTVMSIVILLFTISSVIFIISALHPHRSRPPENDEEADTPAEEAVLRRSSSNHRQKEILSAINTVVVEQKAYLDSHLTIQDVADRCGYSRSSLSSLFKAELGGFFYYVNKLRLAHVEAYLQEHPDASVQEAALESGFNSRQAYYSVKAKI